MCGLEESGVYVTGQDLHVPGLKILPLTKREKLLELIFWELLGFLIITTFLLLKNRSMIFVVGF